MAEMDGSAFSLLGLEDELSCSICLSPFDCPVTIPCGHNFCQDCLLATWKDSYSCPQCRTHFATKPELKKNTVLSTVVETFRLRTSRTSEAGVMVEEEEEDEVEVQGEKVKAIRCDACMEADASQTCLTCMASFCEEHLRPHRDNPIFKVHQLIEPVGDLSERICPDHHKLMELFCSQHGRPICSLCLQQAHKGCPFMSPEEQRDRKESDLRGKLGLLDGQIAKNENVLSQMSSMQNKLQDSATKKKATLAANYQQMRDMLAQAEHEALNIVDRELETSQTKLTGLMKKATDNVNTMSKAKDKIQGLLSQSQTPAFLQVTFNIPKVAKKDPSAPQINLNSKEMLSSQAFSFALKAHLTEILKQPVEARLHILKQGAKAAPGSAPPSSGGTGSQPESEVTKPQKQRRQPTNQQWFQQANPAGYMEANGPFYPPRFMGPQFRPGQKARPYGGGPPVGWFSPSGPQWVGPCPQPKMHPKKKPQKDNMGKKDQAHSMEGHLDFSGKENPRGSSPAPESKETSASVVETSDIPPNITSAERRSELLKYGTVLTLDPKTAHKRIVLSEEFTKASVSDQHTDYPDCPERFNVCSQVLASQGFSRGRHYWEVRLSSSNFIGIGLAYGSIDRKGPTSRLGRNAQSWCIEWFNVKLSAWYNSSETVLVNPNPKRVGVLLDFEEGTATFYNVADRAYPFHSFVFPFAEHVYPAFWIFSSGSSVSLCKLQA